MEEIAKYFDGDAVDVAEVANAEMKVRGISSHVEMVDTVKGGNVDEREL
jgi:hypothetical protein